MKRIYTTAVAMVVVASALVAQTPQRITVGGNVMATKIANQVAPAYPEMAKQAGIQGVVRMNVVIGTDGRMQDMKVISGHPMLVMAAMQAVRQWTYRPTMLNDQPVEVSTTVDVNFTLDGAAATGPSVAAKTLEDQLKASLGPVGMVMRTVVKNAPYSGEEVSETEQTLGDGTRIHNVTRAKVYRDSEGRVRRETPTSISIFDPVAGTGYTLDPAAHTARKTMFYSTAAPGSEGPVLRATISEKGSPEEIMEAQQRLVKIIAEQAATMPMPVMDGVVISDGRGGRGGRGGAGQPESLGTQTMEGLSVKGTRTTSTIPEGAIGNDRPIESVSERWYSADLQTIVMTKHSDPRSGTQTFQLTNVLRAEPSATLFQLPPDYTVVNNGMKINPREE